MLQAVASNPVQHASNRQPFSEPMAFVTEYVSAAGCSRSVWVATARVNESPGQASWALLQHMLCLQLALSRDTCMGVGRKRCL